MALKRYLPCHAPYQLKTRMHSRGCLLQETRCQVVSDCVNMHLLGLAEGSLVARDQPRISLTIRRVLKVKAGLFQRR